MIGLLIFLLFLIFTGVTVYTWLRLHKSINQHAKESDELPETYHLPYEKVALTTKDNIKLAAWYIKVPKPKAVIILLHGRSLTKSGKSMMLPLASDLYLNNYSTFLLDMRGYGESEGEKILFGTKEWQDALAVYEYIRKENEKIKIGFLGVSLGGVVGLITAGKKQVGNFVIASTPFVSHFSLFSFQVFKENVFPKFLFRWALYVAALIELGFGIFEYNASFFIGKIKVPVFLISAKKDKVVNPKDAWELYEKSNKPNDFWEADSPHDVYGDNKQEFLNRVLNFLQLYEG